MRAMRITARRRRAFAIVTCLLWLVGIEILPNLHLATHDDTTHTHGPTGMIVTVSFGAPAHAHDDGSIHSHDAADHAADLTRQADRERHRDQLALDNPVSTHAAGGLAHHALALHSPPPPLLAPLPVVRLVSSQIALPAGRVGIAFVATADARGPPVA